jgi:large subunit ribosomal protein L10
MISRSQRTQKIEELEAMFGSSIGFYLTDINRISVAKMTRLRTLFRKQGLKYVVVKNKLARIALERCGKSDVMPYLEGPIGIVFADHDSTAPARIIRDFQKDNKELLDVRAVYVEGSLLEGAACGKLADLPSREVLLSQLLSVMKAPVQKLAGTLSSVISTFARTLDAVRAQKETAQ